MRNSSRVFGSSRNRPNIDEVTVMLPGFSTPLIVMHMWLCRNTRNWQLTTISTNKYKRRLSLPGFNYNCNSLGWKNRFNRTSNLFRKPFLNLKTAWIHFSYPGQLAQTQNFFIRNVSNVNLDRIDWLTKQNKTKELRFTLPVKGTKWCSQRENIEISLTITISSWFSSNKAPLITSTHYSPSPLIKRSNLPSKFSV